jgi:hypothetical protein
MGLVPIMLDSHREQVCEVSIHFLQYTGKNCTTCLLYVWYPICFPYVKHMCFMCFEKHLFKNMGFSYVRLTYVNRTIWKTCVNKHMLNSWLSHVFHMNKFSYVKYMWKFMCFSYDKSMYHIFCKLYTFYSLYKILNDCT